VLGSIFRGVLCYQIFRRLRLPPRSRRCAPLQEKLLLVLTSDLVIPKPYQLWSQSHRKAVLPLYLCLSTAWGTEMVTHLESLCFLIFLLNAGSGVQVWFRSWYFKAWAVGSFVSLVSLPLIAILTRSDPLKVFYESFQFAMISNSRSLKPTFSSAQARGL
jgi:hypothetical protein